MRSPSATVVSKTNSDATAAVAGLHALGFSETEAVLYCELLQSPGATGYRLSQLTGKSQANTYQALNGLVKKGAAYVDEAEPSRHHAVPYPELLAQLRRGFENRFDSVARSLAELPSTPRQTAQRSIRTLRQLHETAETMINAAREALVFNIFPAHFSVLEPALRAAIARGVAVAGSVYRPEHVLPGAKIYLAGSPDRLVANTVGDKLIVLTDAEQFLVGMSSKGGDEAIQASVSDDDLLASWLHQGIISDLVLEAIGWHDSANRFLFGSFPPGIRKYYRET